MLPEEMDAFLDHSLKDTHFSRSERKTLGRSLEAISDQPRLMNQFRQRAFDKARQAMEHPRDRAVLEWLEDMLNVLEGRRKLPKTQHSHAYFSPGPQCRAKIIECLHRATKAVDICVFTITDNHISEALKSVHKRGVKVRIISDNHKSEDRGSDIEHLADFGIPVRIDNTRFHMHHKFALFDRETLLTGSYNWTISAADVNNENIVILEDSGTVRSFIKEFDRLWNTLSSYPD